MMKIAVMLLMSMFCSVTAISAQEKKKTEAKPRKAITHRKKAIAAEKELTVPGTVKSPSDTTKSSLQRQLDKTYFSKPHLLN